MRQMKFLEEEKDADGIPYENSKTITKRPSITYLLLKIQDTLIKFEEVEDKLRSYFYNSIEFLFEKLKLSDEELERDSETKINQIYN